MSTLCLDDLLLRLLMLNEPSPCDLIFMMLTPSGSSIGTSLSSLSWVGDRIGSVVFFDLLVLLGELIASFASDCTLGVWGGESLNSDLMSLLSSSSVLGFLK